MSTAPTTPPAGHDRGRRVALLCAACALLTGLLATLAAQNGWFSPSALVKLSSQEPLAGPARASDPGFVLVNPQEHYDGVYYYAIARDPLALGVEHTLIDQAPYRYGHPMLGWLARVVSLGVTGWIPGALLLLSLAGLATAGWAASRLSLAAGRTPWGGLVVATSPGLLYATTVSTTEPVSAALLGLVLLSWGSRRLGLSAVLLALLCLTKEQYVTVPAGLALVEAAQALRRRRLPSRLVALVAALTAGPLALAGWALYLHSRFGQWPSTGTPGNVAAPVVGWLETFRQGHLLSGGSFDQSQIGAVSAPVLVAVAALVLAAAVVAGRLRSPLDGVFLGLAAVLACLGPVTLLYPHELVRNPSVTLLAAVGVLLARPTPTPTPTPTPDQSGSVPTGG